MQRAALTWVYEKHSNKEIKGIKTETAKSLKVNYDRNVNEYQINENTTTIEVMRTCIRKARKCWANSMDNKEKDVRNFGVMI